MNEITTTNISELTTNGTQVHERNNDVSMKHNSGVIITKDEEFTTISIDKEYTDKNLHGKPTNTKVRTEIKKSNDGLSKETYISKIFISTDSENKRHLVYREIFIDQNSGKKIINDQKVALKIDNGKGMDEILKNLNEIGFKKKGQLLLS